MVVFHGPSEDTDKAQVTSLLRVISKLVANDNKAQQLGQRKFFLLTEDIEVIGLTGHVVDNITSFTLILSIIA